MIKTVADFIEEFKKKGLDDIREMEYVDHPTLIGDMYEGLTQKLLNSTVFASLDLRIVSGKIKNAKGGLTSQIDCMIVEGPGEALPFTSSHIYHFSQVIAVIEVKKNLFTNEIDASFANLRTVLDVSIEPEKDGDEYINSALRDAWKSMVRTELPERSELESFSEEQQLIYHTLFMEAYFPIRIVIGYYGFKTEFSLREGFANYLDEKSKNGAAKGYGIGSIPSLIICGDNTIIKNNGMPYGIPFLDNEFYWPICVTSNEKPIVHLLEVIWTRLSYKYKISSSIFGEDLDLESAHEFINCKIGKDDKGNCGWMYNYYPFSEKVLNKAHSEIKQWEPIFLTKKQLEILYILTKKEFINYNSDKEFINFVTKDGTTKDEFIDSLIKTGLIYKRDMKIKFLTDECKLMILPDGRCCAGENKNREFDHWLKRYMEDRDKKTDGNTK